jgi:TatD DNase family protein
VIDTHCHLYLEKFTDDIDEVLDRAEEAGVTDICMPAITFDSLEQMEALPTHNVNLHDMVGLHPCDVEEVPDHLESTLQRYAQQERFVAIGETGLDYYWSTDHVEAQKQSLHIHCEVAKAVDKPIVLHNRDSTQDVLDIIDQHQDGSLTGVWHCFNGSVEEGKRAIDLGLHLGIGGILTFKNAGVDKTVAELPLNVMILETDAPYLAPSPNRGKRNEPSFVQYTAQKLAEVKGKDISVIKQQTSKQARQLFNLI